MPLPRPTVPAPFPAFRAQQGAQPAVDYQNAHTGGGLLGNLLGWNGNPFYDALKSPKVSRNLEALGWGLMRGHNLSDGLSQYAQIAQQMQPEWSNEDQQRQVQQIGDTAKANTAKALRAMAARHENDPDLSDLADAVENGSIAPSEAFAAGLSTDQQLRKDATDRTKAKGLAGFIKDPTLSNAVATGAMTFQDANAIQQRHRNRPLTPDELAQYGLTGQSGFQIDDADSQVSRITGMGGSADDQETWGLQPQPYKMPDGTVRIGVVSNRGNFKPVDLPDGAQPAFPVQQLNTGTDFTGVGKFGDPTGAKIPINNTQAAFDTGIGTGLAKETMDQRGGAVDAAASLQAASEARKLLDSGVITGFGANFKLGLGKALQQVGFTAADDPIANTEAFVATRAQEVGRIIKLFGAGTGLSDADREYATRAAAGQITLDEASIRKILDINERAARNVMRAFNDRATSIGTGGIPSLQVPVPSAPGGGPSLPDPFGIR